MGKEQTQVEVEDLLKLASKLTEQVVQLQKRVKELEEGVED